MNNEYCFSINNLLAKNGIKQGLFEILGGQMPVIICVGTDATIGDSLGPLVGTMLVKKELPAYVYGTLDTPVTAKEIVYAKKFVENAHPYSKVLIIDAAVGKKEDVGLIKVNATPIKPGLGANKNLPEIGDSSIIGIVAPRSEYNYSLLNLTRLNLIYRFSEIIADGIEEFFNFSRCQVFNENKVI